MPKEFCAYDHTEYVSLTTVLAKYKIARVEVIESVPATRMLTMEQMVCGHHLGSWVDNLVAEKGDTTTIRIEKMR